jgi:hypothetical protein
MNPNESSSQGAFGLDRGRRYDQNTYLGTHNAYANRHEGWITPNQEISITEQLDRGVRYINADVWLVRQGIYVVPFPTLPIPSVIVYNGEDVSPPNDPLWAHLEDLEVVVAHEPRSTLYLLKTPPFKKLSAVLADIRAWLESHPGEVVTLGLENGVHAAHQDMVMRAVDESGIKPAVFFLDRPNEGMVFPDRPQDGGWDVTIHGFPSLDQLVAAGRRLVLLPDDGHPGSEVNERDMKWRFQVNTVYGRDSLDPGTWTNPRDESASIDDLTRPLFLMEHAPVGPALYPVYPNDYNDFDRISRRWQDMADRWGRLPSYFTCDFFNYDDGHGIGGGTPEDPSGPMQITSFLNARWAELPVITPTAELSPPPNASGWNNSDVRVNLSGRGDTIVGTVSSTLGQEKSPKVRDGGGYVLSMEGVTTVSFAAIGRGGAFWNRSAQTLVDVRIDKTPPVIVCTGNAGTYIADAPVDITCTATDDRSGVEAVTPPGLTGEAWQFGVGDVSIPVEARDRAGNMARLSVAFKVIVTRASLGNLTRRWVSNSGVTNALLKKLDAAERAAARGDLAGKVHHVETYIHELETHVGRFVSADHAATLIRLARAL